MRGLVPVLALSLSTLCAALEPSREHQGAILATEVKYGKLSMPNNFRPWLVDEGTLVAHIMMPANWSYRSEPR